MVRLEALVVTAFGAVGGIGLGLFLGWGVMALLAEAEGLPAPYVVPRGAVVTILGVGLVVGLAASGRPARRAARFDVVRAIEL